MVRASPQSSHMSKRWLERSQMVVPVRGAHFVYRTKPVGNNMKPPVLYVSTCNYQIIDGLCFHLMNN